MPGVLRVLQGFSEQHYHTIPGAVQSITVSPEREAIFRYLAQVGPDRFHEFVADVLVDQKHALVDITNGPGDEKQDILTIAPDGKRQLTQCKHTINYADRSSGDDLDLLYAACMRKDCTRGLWVTNADLTTQAKRYVNDKEYLRGWHGPAEAQLDIEYWNGARLWELVKVSGAILNKWFSGMAQSHGLRQFFFDVVALLMPSGTPRELRSADVAKNVKERIDSLAGGRSFRVYLNDDVSFSMSDWFCTDYNLDMNFVGPERVLVNAPLPALRIEIHVASSVLSYDVAAYRDAVIRCIADAVLPAGEGWHYVAANAPKAFVFFHDILKPKDTSIADAQSYVKIPGFAAQVEKEWVFPTGAEYERVGDDELFWRHKQSGIKVTLGFSQQPDPVSAYQYHLAQQHSLIKMVDYAFRFVPGATGETVERVRRSIDRGWTLLISEKNDLFYGFPTTTDQELVDRVDGMFRESGIVVQPVSDDEKMKLIQSVTVDPVSWAMVSSEAAMVTPVWLNKRMIWLSQELRIQTPLAPTVLAELLRFKIDYEVEHGFDVAQGRSEMCLSGREIPGFLFDFFSFRGERMLDLGFTEHALSCNLRVQGTSLASTNELLPTYIDDLQKIEGDIQRILTGTP